MIVLRLLGGFEIAPRPAQRLGKPALRLIALVALRESISRDELSEFLWPYVDRSQRLFYLRRTILEIRKAFDPAENCPLDIFEDRILLPDGRVSLDVRDYMRALKRGDTEEAVRRFGVGLLPGWDDEWIDSFRLDLDLSLNSHLSSELERAEASLDFARADMLRRELVKRSPGDEETWQSLIRDTARRRGRIAAMELFEECNRILVAHTGTGASEETRLLVQERGHRVRHHLVLPPKSATHLIGRDRAIGECLDLTASHRLVTIIASGGVGKTFLASHIAHQLNEMGSVQVGWVDLASVSDARGIAQAFAFACGVRSSAEVPQWRQFLDAVSQSKLTLVLDNAEHVLMPLAGMVSELLERAPGIRLIVTSRSALGLPSEVRYRLSSLSEDSALDLLKERLRIFGAPVNSMSDLRALSALVDGIPLAIELCAASLTKLPLANLSERIRSLLALDAEGINRSPRHATMRAAIAASVTPLNPAVTRGFSRLCLFMGGFELSAGEAIAALSPLDLADLVERSLVEFDGKRYRLLEPTRRFCMDLVEQNNDLENLKESFGRYFGELAKDLYGEHHIRDTNPGEFERIRSLVLAEDKNFAQAHAFLEAQQDHLAELPTLIRIVRITYRSLDIGSDDAVAWAHRLTETKLPDNFWVGTWVLLAAQYVSWTSRIDLQQQLLGYASGLSAVHESPELLCWFHQSRHNLSYDAEVDISPEAEYCAALTAARLGGNDLDIRHTSALLAEWYVREGQYEKAERILNPLIDEAIKAKDVRAGAIALRTKSRLPSVSNWEEKRALLEIGEALQRRSGHWALIHTLGELKLAALRFGHLEQARKYAVECCDVCEERDDGPALAHALQGLAFIDLELGQPQLAIQEAIEGATYARQEGHKPYIHAALLKVAQVLLRAGNSRDAAHLLGYVTRAVELRAFPTNSLIRGLVHELRNALKDPEHVLAIQEGNRMGLDEAFDLILALARQDNARL